MRTNKIVVAIAEESDAFRKSRSDKPSHHGGNMHYLTRNQFASVFSEKRLELVLNVKKNPHYSVNQLAQSLKRKQEAISRDLAILTRLGLITKTRAKKPATIKTPAPIPAISFSIR